MRPYQGERVCFRTSEYMLLEILNWRALQQIAYLAWIRFKRLKWLYCLAVELYALQFKISGRRYPKPLKHALSSCSLKYFCNFIWRNLQLTFTYLMKRWSITKQGTCKHMDVKFEKVILIHIFAFNLPLPWITNTFIKMWKSYNLGGRNTSSSFDSLARCHRTKKIYWTIFSPWYHAKCYEYYWSSH